MAHCRARSLLGVVCLLGCLSASLRSGARLFAVGVRGQRSAAGSRLKAVPSSLAELPAEAKAWADKHLVNEAAKFAESKFPLSPEELVSKAKVFLALNNGFAGSAEGMMAEDFEFAGPVVGPLNKERYERSIAGFDFYRYFPDANFEMYDFRVDPLEPNRVWFTSRGRGTQTGSDPSTPLFKTATGKSYVNPPQTCSVTFNEEGLVSQYTIGYVMDRRVGNTGGLGGIYGIMWAVGKPFPFPEAQPRKPSLRSRLFNWLGDMMAKKKSDK